MDPTVDNRPDDPELARRIRRVFVAALGLELDPAAVGDDLRAVAGMDSLATLEFVAGLESELGVTIEPDRLSLDLLGDVRALTAYFGRRLRERGG
jgi:acyl carrier protein